MSIIQPQLSVYDATGITGGGWTGTSSPIFGYNNVRVSWLADQDSTLNIQQTPDGVTPMFIDTYSGVSGIAKTVVVAVKSEETNVDISFAGTPTALTLETFFFSGVNSAEAPVSTVTTVALTVATGTVLFDNIVQTGTNLRLTGLAQSTLGSLDTLLIQFNGDTTTAYLWQEMYGQDTFIGAASSGIPDRGTRIGFIQGNGTTGISVSSTWDCSIPNYAQSTTTKCMTSTTFTWDRFIAILGGLWQKQNAITSITLLLDGGADFVPGSYFNLEII